MDNQTKDVLEMGMIIVCIIIIGIVVLCYPIVYASNQMCEIKFDGEMNLPFINNTYIKGGASIVMPCDRMMEILEKS